MILPPATGSRRILLSTYTTDSKTAQRASNVEFATVCNKTILRKQLTDFITELLQK